MPKANPPRKPSAKAAAKKLEIAPPVRGKLPTEGISVQYVNFANDEWLAQVERELGSMAFLIPCWVRHLAVTVVENGGDDVANIMFETKYRRAALNIYPSWFASSARERKLNMIHELMHLVLAPLTEFAEGDGEEDPAREKAIESTTEDMAWAVLLAMEKGTGDEKDT